MVQLPNFSEANHPMIQSLFHYSDRELLTLFQRYPDEGKYFTAIYCRYGSIVYSLIQHQVQSPVQVDYLFALTWRHMFHELRGLDLSAEVRENSKVTLQSWLINTTALCIRNCQLPQVESIHYSLQISPPPLWVYVQQALDLMPALMRIILIMDQTFHWSPTRIAAYLQAEGESISTAEVNSLLKEAYQRIESLLPPDIRSIYCAAEPVMQGKSKSPSPKISTY
jgi:DNA-directed RNA polymerase specialized sigma24 family protein